MANTQPHTHKVEVASEYYSGNGRIRVTYGDTSVMLHRRAPFLDARTRRAVKRCIAKHDHGTLKLTRRERALAAAQLVAANTYNAHLQDVYDPKTSTWSRVKPGKWGSEIMAEVRGG